MVVSDKGSALVVVMLALLLFTLLGAAALQMGQMELEQGRLQAQQLRAGYLAESGLELAVGWFARPEQFAGRMRQLAGPCPVATHAGELFAARCLRNDGADTSWLSFLTDDGISQFYGTREQPDGVMTIVAGLLFPGMASSDGATLEVSVFAPGSRGAVCTVLAIARSGGNVRQAVQAELTELPLQERVGRWPVVTLLPGSWRPLDVE
jgi:hypothetical protein